MDREGGRLKSRAREGCMPFYSYLYTVTISCFYTVMIILIPTLALLYSALFDFNRLYYVEKKIVSNSDCTIQRFYCAKILHILYRSNLKYNLTKKRSKS
jgi:hypothetical protein